MLVADVIKNIRLFLKLSSGDSLSLADFPSLINSRWVYIRDNWNTSIRPDLLRNISSFKNSDNVLAQIKKFDDFVDTRRSFPNEINILEENNLYFTYFDLFDAITISKIQLRREDQELINSIINDVSNYTKLNWTEMRDVLYKEMRLVSNYGGVVDADVNYAYGIKPVSSDHTYDMDDIDKTVFYLNQIKYINFILADKGGNDPKPIDPFALAKYNANNDQYDIQSFNAGMFVKMDYGDTLQTLADKYMGTSDRWMEIAIANGLQPPYIDEIGEKILLTVNGDRSKLYLPKISNTTLNIDKFYIGQPIYISSNTYSIPEQRIIKGIQKVPVSDEVIIETEGVSDLDKYLVSDDAMIRVYKKHTTNSNYLILIPTSNVPQEDLVNKDELPWFLRIKDDDEIKQKVDLSVNDDGDLVISSSDDLMLSYGIRNAVQALLLKFRVEMGEVKRHPRFGFIGGIIGSKNINLGANRQKIIDYISEQVSRDDRFDSIVSLDVQTFSNYYVINLVVRLSGGLNKTIPISFKIEV